MKKKSDILIFVLLVLGIAILAYPTLSNYLATKNQSKVVQEYTRAIENYSDKEMLEMLDKARAYNATLSGTRMGDPFEPSSQSTLADTYLSILNIDSVIGYITIPSIHVNIPIYHSISDSVLSKGIGHMDATAFPIGGNGAHAVLTGHRGLPNAKLFTDLDLLVIGDIFYIHVLNLELTYEIDQISIVEPNDTNLLEPLVDQDYVTLVTCTPYAINSHRLLIRGTRVEENIEVDIVEDKESKPWVLYSMISLTIGSIAFSFYFYMSNRKK